MRRLNIYRMIGAGSISLLLVGCGTQELMRSRELSMPFLITSGVLENAGSKSELPQIALQLNGGRLVAEIASTPTQAAAGLALRTRLAPDGAMLFIYPTPHRVVFHMKDTYIPLSVAYIDSLGRILEIHDLTPGVETPVVSISTAVRFVLEVNRGWFDMNGVTTGCRIFVEQ